MSQHSEEQGATRPSQPRSYHRPRAKEEHHPSKPDEQPGNNKHQKLRVQRRKTKRERNNAKFGRPEFKRSLDQKGSALAFQRAPIPQRCTWPASITALKSTCSSNPVVITQNRLTQHLGMFNHEIKSADIGRLLGQDKDLADVASLKCSHQKECQVDPCGVPALLMDEVAAAKSPTPSELAERFLSPVRGVQNTGGKLPAEQHLQPNTGNPELGPHTATCSTQLAQTPGFGRKDEGTMAIQTSAFSSTSDKENTPLEILQSCQTSATHGMEKMTPGRTLPAAARAPVKEVVVKLLTILNPPAAFSGRSLVSETRQRILAILMDRYGRVPDIPLLTVCRRWDYSSTPRVLEGDCGSVRSSDGWHSCGSREGHKDHDLSHHGKRMRQQSPPPPFTAAFLSSTSVAPTVPLSAEKAKSQKEDLDLCEELHIQGQHRQCIISPVNSKLQSVIPMCTDNPRPVVLMHRDNTTLDQDKTLSESKPVSRRQHIFEECLPPLNSQRTVWDTKRNLEGNTNAFRQAIERNKPKTYGLPFGLSDSTAIHNPQFNICSNSPICLNTMNYPTCGNITHCSKAQSREVETDIPKEHLLGRGLGIQAQNILGHQQLRRGFSLQNPTSFGGSTNIHRNNILCGGREKSVSKAFDLVQMCEKAKSLLSQISEREPYSNQGPQTKPNSLLEQQPCCQLPPEMYLHGQNIKECKCCSRVSTVERKTGILRNSSQVHSHVAEITACNQTSIPRTVGCHSRTHHCMVSWDPRSSSIRGVSPCGDHSEQRCLSALDYFHSTRHSGLPEQNRPLPISFYPPSEELEKSLASTPNPYIGFTGPLLERLSPESWVFPRMKLY
ncbi:proline-rich protein 19 [Ambystoma mexicanum]|uniref:proline-rich protein 19 n=1 Tax=Ambystoma mexicanum TaxID=8296 RepID=UPI0037E7101C